MSTVVNIEVVGVGFIPLNLLDPRAAASGKPVSDTAGGFWTLATSTATVDHTTVEAVLNTPSMRWLIETNPATAISSLTGSVLATGPGAAAATLKTQVSHSFLGVPGSSTAEPTAMTPTQATALLNAATTSLPGLESAADKTMLTGLQGSKATVVGSAVQDLTITGLTGDSDGGYEFEGLIITTASSPLLSLQINGSAQGHTIPTYVTYNGATAVVSAGLIGARLEVGSNEQGTASNVTFRGRIGSKQGLIQAFNSRSMSVRTDNAVGFTTDSVGQFTMGAEITSLSIHSSDAGQIDVGSYLRVRKLGFAE